MAEVAAGGVVPGHFGGHWAVDYIRRMSATISQPRQSLPVWLGVLVWLAAFVSPAAYFILLLLATDCFGGGRFAPPQVVVWALSCLIPILALVICGAVVWRSTRKPMFRLCWMVFTLMAMLIQLGIILFVLRAIIVTRIAYLQ